MTYFSDLNYMTYLELLKSFSVYLTLSNDNKNSGRHISELFQFLLLLGLYFTLSHTELSI